VDHALNEANDVVSKKDYLAALRRVIRQMHHCEAIHSRSVKVHEIFHGKTVWDGEVEVYDLPDHPQAKTCYAWAHLRGNKDERTRYVTVLAIPPVTTALAAVKASIMVEAKKQES